MTAAKYNAENERIKRRYFEYLKEAKRYSVASLDEVAKALHRFESYSRFRDFRKFHIAQAIAFKRFLEKERNIRTGKPLSKATLQATLANLRGFFHWLAGQPGFRARLSYSDAEYFSLSKKDRSIAMTVRDIPFPSLEQVLHALNAMPAQTVIQQRDRAVIALALLTGARDGALASLKLKHLDLAERKLVQDAREVKTKFSKTFSTWFFPVGPVPVEIIRDWADYLRKQEGFGPDDPLFPQTKVILGDKLQFEAAGITREHWSTGTPIRKIFRDAFTATGLPYFNPHSLRKTLTQLGERLCTTPEDFKAWSQNIGHGHILTTFNSYGAVSGPRQAEIIRKLGQPKEETGDLLHKLRELINSGGKS